MKKLLVVLLVSLGLQTQAQISTLCDSIELSVAQGQQSWFVTVETNLNPNNFPIQYVQSYNWTSHLMCGTSIGTDTSSLISFFTDTLQMYSVCLTSVFCDSNLCYTCITCDTLVWNNGSWGMISMVNNNTPTSIQELKPTTFNDNKIYDMLGREITNTPVGTIYIVNRKKYIKK